MNPADIESLERATVQAVAPERVDSLPGWLLPMDPGTVGRARSAVPLVHESKCPLTQLRHTLSAIVLRYEAAGYVPQFRLPDAAAALCDAVADLGFVRVEPTLVMHGTLAGLLQCPGPDPGVHMARTPDAQWMQMFLGPGLDAVDGAHRARNLARAPDTWYASLRAPGPTGNTLACGAASLSHGWLGVHGMRTAQAHRGQGLAGRVLAAMANEARAHGIERVFLQVGAGNDAALALYARKGLQVAWPYAYWKRPVPWV